MPDTRLPARSPVVDAADCTIPERRERPLAGTGHRAPLVDCESDEVNGMHFLEMTGHFSRSVLYNKRMIIILILSQA